MLCAQHTVPVEFGRGQIGRPCRQFSRVTILDQISACYHYDTVRVLLLRSVVNNNPGVRDNTVTWDQCYFNVGHDKD